MGYISVLHVLRPVLNLILFLFTQCYMAQVPEEETATQERFHISVTLYVLAVTQDSIREASPSLLHKGL
jgi:hypothetical protein